MHGLNGFDCERWSTGSWFGTRGRYRCHACWRVSYWGACAGLCVWLPDFVWGFRRLRRYG